MDYWTFSTYYIRRGNALPNDAALARLARSSLTDEQSNAARDEWGVFIEQAKQAVDYQSLLNTYNNQLSWLH